MFRLLVAGRPVPAGLLTVDDLDRLRDGSFLLELLTRCGVANPESVRLADVAFDDADMPSVFEDGLPQDGPLADKYVAVFGMPPWCWPPSVIRAQTVRDLELLLTAVEAKE